MTPTCPRCNGTGQVPDLTIPPVIPGQTTIDQQIGWAEGQPIEEED